MILELLMTSTVLILGILCLRKLTMGKISMRLRYALWLLVAVRLLVPLSVGTSTLSVMNLLPETVRESAQILTAGWENGRQQSADGGRKTEYVREADEAAAGERIVGEEAVDVRAKAETADMSAAASLENALEKPAGEAERDVRQGEKDAAGLKSDSISLLHVLGMFWLLGFLTVGGYLIVSEWRFIRYLHKNRKAFPAEAIPQEFTERFFRRGIKVYQVKGLPGPCLAGRSIYIGERIDVQGQNLGHILAHEYCHALHGDGLWAFLRCALAAVYWFDPFVWAAAYAARRDSELACDEAAVRLLGESSRFAYGRTLLALVENTGSREKCPGMTFMTEGGGTGVGERITALARKSRTRGSVLAAVLAAVVLICGCAFTGAERKDGEGQPHEAAGNGTEKIGTEQDSGVDQQAAKNTASQNRRMLSEGENGEFSRIQEEHEEVVKNERLMEEQRETALQEAEQAAFEEVLDYHGVMEGKDDSELSLKRRVDEQTYYQYTLGEAGNPMENGWYLLGENEDAGISLYGLYTETFGFRGLKTLIGEDVNDFDGQWCVSLMNGLDENIRVLEQAQDGLPRRFVWKLLAEESGTTEFWRFYSAYRYDTGTVDVKVLTEEDCLSWAKEHLSFTVDQEAAEVDVICDGDMYLGAIDISAYADWKTEEVQIVPDVVSFVLDDPGADIYQAYSDAVWEKTALHLAVGLKFAEIEGIWFDGLPVLTIQIAEDEDSASGFRLNHPRIDETYVGRALWQEKKLAELRAGISAEQAAPQEGNPEKQGSNDLEKPVENGGEAHHDVEITFSNPCPAYDYVSAWYGEGIDPATGKLREHTAVDMAAAEGADILAAAEGEVFMTGFDAANGNYVVLWHVQSGQMTYYAHCKTVEVKKGQQVAQGDKIATVGQTGRATGPCLHFAVSSGSSWEEPYFLDLK